MSAVIKQPTCKEERMNALQVPSSFSVLSLMDSSLMIFLKLFLTLFYFPFLDDF